MMTITECLENGLVVRDRKRTLQAALSRISEVFWFSVSLLLFMILGPFAAPVALAAIFGLDSSYRGQAEPESKQ